jgi:hypothetical protein
MPGTVNYYPGSQYVDMPRCTVPRILASLSERPHFPETGNEAMYSAEGSRSMTGV